MEQLILNYEQAKEEGAKFSNYKTTSNFKTSNEPSAEPMDD